MAKKKKVIYIDIEEEDRDEENKEEYSFFELALMAFMISSTSYFFYQTYFNPSSLKNVRLIVPDTISLTNTKIKPDEELEKSSEKPQNEPEKKVAKVPSGNGILAAAKGLPGSVFVMTADKKIVANYNGENRQQLASNVKLLLNLAVLIKADKKTVQDNLSDMYYQASVSDNGAAQRLGNKLIGTAKDSQDILNKSLGTKFILTSHSGCNGGRGGLGKRDCDGPLLGLGQSSIGTAKDMTLSIIRLDVEARKKGLKLNQILGNTKGPGTLGIHLIDNILGVGKTGTLNDTKAYTFYTVSQEGVGLYGSILVDSSSPWGEVPQMNRIFKAVHEAR